MNSIRVHDKDFRPYINREEIATRVKAMAADISSEYKGRRPLFLAVLNGSFVFASDLFRALSIEAEISFIKLASYKGTSSTGNVVTAIGLEEQLHGRDVILLEDIVDTGRTLHDFLPEVRMRQPASLRICAFLTKPTALQHKEVHVDYIGFEVPNLFVLGYGLDYDGLGRNLPDLWQVA